MIKVVALDVYGTIVPTDDPDNTFSARKGLEKFLDRCKEKDIVVVTSSDANIPDMKRDLKQAFSHFQERGLSIERFDNFFCLKSSPKDFSVIIGYYDINPTELLVIGDDYNKDIIGALKLGCQALHCPEYLSDGERTFDFSKIDLDLDYSK